MVYRDTPQEWVQQRVRECRRLALKKKTNAPVCSVYIGPPRDKPPLRSRPPRFLVIDEDQGGLAPFLDAVASKGSEL